MAQTNEKTNWATLYTKAKYVKENGISKNKETGKETSWSSVFIGNDREGNPRSIQIPTNYIKGYSADLEGTNLFKSDENGDIVRVSIPTTFNVQMTTFINKDTGETEYKNEVLSTGSLINIFAARTKITSSAIKALKGEDLSKEPAVGGENKILDKDKDSEIGMELEI